MRHKRRAGGLRDAGGLLRTGGLVVMLNEKETLHWVGPPYLSIAVPVAQCCCNGCTSFAEMFFFIDNNVTLTHNDTHHTLTHNDTLTLTHTHTQ